MQADGDWEYVVEEDGGARILRYTGAGGAVIIPNEVNGVPVRHIGAAWSGSGVFEGQNIYTSVVSVTIPDTVKTIGSSAFAYCWRLTNVTIPNSVTNLGYRSFWECQGLTSFSTGSGVIEISDDALLGTSVTNVFLGRSVASLGNNFYGKYNLVHIDVDGENPNYTSVEGVLYNKSMSELLIFPAGRQGAFVIPGTVTNIGAKAFLGSGLPDGFTIPNSVTRIENSAFEESRLKEIVIPDGVTHLGERAFWGSTLTNVTIPNSVTNVGGNAFAKCRGLTSIVIPNSVLNFGAYLMDCSGLTNVVLPNQTSWIGTFQGCGSLRSVNIPSDLTSIPESAFAGCTSLTNLFIPSTVTYIGDGAFAGTYSLTNSLVIPEGVTEIRPETFCGSGISGITIPSTITNISSMAFGWCRNLRDVSIPDGVHYVANGAFIDCEGLTNVTIGQGTVGIASSAFKGCRNLRNFSVAPGNPNFASPDGILTSKAQDLIIRYPPGKNLGQSYIIPNSVTTIGALAFERSELKDLIIPGTVSAISQDAFLSCNNLSRVFFMGQPPAIQNGGSMPNFAKYFYRANITSWGNYDFGGRPHGPILPMIKNNLLIATNSPFKHKLTFETLPGLQYSVQRSTDLDSWSTVQEVDGDGADKEFEETVVDRAFYRIRQN